MMQEIVGTFGSFGKVSEALEELYSEGIVADRVHVETACAPSNGAFQLSIDEKHWTSAEYAGHGEHLGVVDFHDHLFESVDLVCDGLIEDEGHTTITVCIKNDAELHAVCDIFSRLGTVDIDEAKRAA
jgi:hypothetical protein